MFFLTPNRLTAPCSGADWKDQVCLLITALACGNLHGGCVTNQVGCAELMSPTWITGTQSALEEINPCLLHANLNFEIYVVVGPQCFI